MDHAESGDSIEREFIQSWDRMEEYFAWILENHRRPYKDQVLQFLTQLRQAGYDRKLRAGQSLDIFLVSRSRHHGLRPEQPAVGFYFSDRGMGVQDGHAQPIHVVDLSLSPAVEEVLARLLSHPID